MRTLLCATAVLALLSGCATTTDDSYAVPALHKQASFDLNCPASQLQIMETSKDLYGVEGCDRRTAYRVEGCNPSTRECKFSRTAPITASRD